MAERTSKHPHPAGIAAMPQGLRARQFGAVNWIGAWSLYQKEVRRFLNVFTQTVLAPAVTGLLFLAVFSLALGRAVETVNGAPFAEFLAPGLIVMAMAQNAFANTCSSLVISKVQGNIIDVLMPPITAGEMVIAYALAGLTRGLTVGVVSALAMTVFVPFQIHSPGAILFFGAAAALMLALIGVLGGLWAEKFDQMAAVTNFLITPFAFLSGTFYSIRRLPEAIQDVAQFNPFFYMIDGFRYGFIGRSDADPLIGAAVMLGVNAALLLLAWHLVRIGYKLKA